MNLFKLTSSKGIVSDNGDDIYVSVFVVAKDDLEAREKAKIAFQQAMREHDLTFEEASKMTEEEAEEAMDGLDVLSYWHGARGLMSCRNLGDCSQPVFEV